MNREARSKVEKDGDRIKITLDEQTEFETNMITFLLMEVTRKPLTEEKARSFINCLCNKYLSCGADIDVAGFEDAVSSIYEILESYCDEIMRGGTTNG